MLSQGYKVLAVGNQQEFTFQQSHLPGAIYFDTNEIESEENGWNILPAQQCQQVFIKKGITVDTPVLIYSSNLNAACRVAFVAYWLGINQIKILEDGLRSWVYPLEQGTVEVEKAEDFGTRIPRRPEILISTSEDLLQAKSRNPELILASVRSREEYSGATSNYSYIEQAGEPEGAIFTPASCGKDDVADLLTADHRLKPLSEIDQAWQTAGLNPEKEIVFYCGTGWRASTAFFVAKELGWSQIRLFDGGWYDWSKKHNQNPKKFPLKKTL
nr:rhodanese-like domain-containing protein [Enterococcus sp. 669A]